jgi:uncharacterized protein (DUF1015 family)
VADVRPLRAVRYAEAEPLKAAVAPPYDVLSEEQVAAYAARSPHNVVRLTRPGADYAGAAARFRSWLDEGVLVEDAEPAMYVHETEFEGRTRRDLLAALRLQPYEDRVVLPHERTHRGPKEDRLALLGASGVAMEPLWFLAERVLPLLEAAPEGEARTFTFGDERHTLRRVTDGAWLASVSEALRDRPVLIADGHHRYETTLAYSQELGAPPDSEAAFTLALLTDLADPGLVVLPTHRLLRAGVAVTGGVPASSLHEALDGIRDRTAAATYRDGAYQVLELEGDVAVLELHRQVIDNLLGKRSAEDMLVYTRDAEEAVRWVDEGAGVAAFLLDRPDLAAVLRVAEAGTTMPQKSTYFAPKPPSGMVFHRLRPDQPM